MKIGNIIFAIFNSERVLYIQFKKIIERVIIANDWDPKIMSKQLNIGKKINNNVAFFVIYVLN